MPQFWSLGSAQIAVLAVPLVSILNMHMENRQSPSRIMMKTNTLLLHWNPSVKSSWLWRKLAFTTWAIRLGISNCGPDLNHGELSTIQEVPDQSKESAGGPWEFCGLLPLFDPPRHDSAETIRRALDLGVNVKMITGNWDSLDLLTAMCLPMLCADTLKLETIGCCGFNVHLFKLSVSVTLTHKAASKKKLM